MAFMRRQAEPVPESETAVWACSDEQCPGWMRSEFCFEDEPTCPLCHTSMVREMRILPEIQY